MLRLSMPGLFNIFKISFVVVMFFQSKAKAGTDLLDESVFQMHPKAWASVLENKAYEMASGATCKDSMEQVSIHMENFDPLKLDKNWLKANGADAIDSLAQLRLRINTNISRFPVDCRLQLGHLLVGLRDLEDYIGEVFYQVTPLHGEDLKFSSEPVPLLEKDKYNPYFLNSKWTDFKFEPGDVMITMGISFVSASISQSTVLPAKYSHGVFVYIDEKTGVPQTIESYISSGAKFFAIDEALKNENARIMLFRSKDRSLAKRANDIMGEKIKKALKLNGRISYDYKSDYTEHEKLTCIEIPYAAYELASDKQVILPQVQSDMMLTKSDMTEGLNIKPGKIFSPFNLELDDRFEMVLEWADYRLTQDQRNKGILTRKMFELMEKEDYVIQENLDSLGARLIWLTRNIPFIFNFLGRVGNLNQLPPDMPVKQIATSAKLNKATGIILMAMRKWQDQFPGRVFTSKEIRDWVSTYIAQDRENYYLGRRDDFHIFFRPYSMKRPYGG